MNSSLVKDRLAKLSAFVSTRFSAELSKSIRTNPVIHFYLIAIQDWREPASAAAGYMGTEGVPSLPEFVGFIHPSVTASKDLTGATRRVIYPRIKLRRRLVACGAGNAKTGSASPLSQLIHEDLVLLRFSSCCNRAVGWEFQITRVVRVQARVEKL